MPGVNRSLFNPLSWLQYAAAALVYCFFYPFIWLAGWRMDAGRAWDRIPFADKGYSIVRNINDPNLKAPKEDGLIEDRQASIASLIDKHRADAQEKRDAGVVLNEEERQLLADDPERHYFKIKPEYDHKNKCPHFLARRHLIEVGSSENTRTMHQDMTGHFKSRFFNLPNSSHLSSLETIAYAVSI
jgi:effector protein SdbA